MVQTAEEVFEIGFQHVAHGRARNHLSEGCERVVGTEPRTATKRTAQEVLFVDCRQYLSHAALQRSIGYTGNAQRPLLCADSIGGCNT